MAVKPMETRDNYLPCILEHGTFGKAFAYYDDTNSK